VSGSARIVENAVCLGCGCACDDIDVVTESGRILEARNACPLGLRWFGDGSLPGAVLGGRSNAIEEVVGEIADTLRSARAPLVYLAPDLTSEAQRAAVMIADQLHAFIDGVTSATASEGILAAQRRGRAGATLGEIRNRADVLVFWAVDPSLGYPRFQSRYAPIPVGVHVPNGRADRTVIAVDVGSQRGPDDADVRIQMTADEEPLFLGSLRGYLAGRTLGGASIVARVTELAARLNRARYAVVVTDAETAPQQGAATPAMRADSLIALTQSLNATTRASLCALRAGGNRNGADTVLTWQTGFPMAVDFSRGAPRYTPEDATLSRLARGDIDAVLLIGNAAALPDAVAGALRGVRKIAIGPRASESSLDVSIRIDTGMASIHESGTAYRTDDIPLPLRAVLPTPRDTASLLKALGMALAAKAAIA
jgi:formylmethanofuran dehydrogenase subunit B